jgi:Sulfotransferase family
MPPNEGATFGRTHDEGSTKPLLFLHIPKTAGTSFLLMLQNTFGDSRVRRIHTVDEHIKEIIETIVSTELDQVSVLAGHLPIHLFADCLDKFQPFTVLREPISRVLSLFRFLKTKDLAELNRLGLRQDFSLDDFLGSTHPELHGQVNNGMVRMLCGDAEREDPECAKFWDKGGWTDALHQAIANLERMDFGVTEEMDLTLELARVSWSVPYQLQQYRENATEKETSAEDVDDIHRIISLNTLDLTLYQWAVTEFRKRARALPTQASPDQQWNPRAVFRPPMAKSVSVANIPGRRGFHEFEEIEIAWLRADEIADIHFVGKADLLHVRLLLLCVVADYPTERITIRVNDQPVTTQFSFVNEKWGWLETEHFETRDGLNQLAIEAPVFLPASVLDPLTGDKRRLGVALANVVLES